MTTTNSVRTRNRSGAIGTRYTSSVIRYMRSEGFGQAELRNLAGRYDLGDIVGVPGVVIECKGGKKAEQAGPQLRSDWLDETEAERVNARAEIGLLVCKRLGAGEGRTGTHDVFLPLWALGALTANPLGVHMDSPARFDPLLRKVPVRISLADALLLLRSAGYGDDLGDGAP